MSDRRYLKTVVGIVASAALLACSALFVAAIKLGATLVSSALVLVFRILLFVVGLLIAACLAGLLVLLIQNVVTRLADLELRYAALTKRLEQRRPTFVSTATITAAMATLLSDKAFGEENVATVCVGIALILLFWVANELLVAETRVKFILGIAAWCLGILLTPGVMLIQEHGDVSRLIHRFQNLNVGVMVIVIASVVLACLAPLLLRSDK